ncbi:MAG: magnesium transporter CorA family protein [Candidatus Diapherotrites archaeon]|nr:magnesium transporter CorA family protein [Candidatus Diapherotrites archaeon]
MARRRKLGEAIYYITTKTDNLAEKLTKIGLPGEQIEQIWIEEDVPDVYFVDGAIIADLNFMDESTLIAIKKNTVAVVAEEETELLRWIKNSIKRRRKFLQNPGTFLYRAIKKQLDIIHDRVSEIHKAVTRVEKTMAKNLRTTDTEMVLNVYDVLLQLHDVRRELAYFWKVVMKLRKTPILKPEEIEDIKGDVHEVLSFVGLTIKSANSILDLHDRALSMELNLLIKRLTAISIILAVITIITGIYGMNFRYIPLANHPYGFWIINGFLVLLYVGMWWWFRRIGWM